VSGYELIAITLVLGIGFVLLHLHHRYREAWNRFDRAATRVLQGLVFCGVLIYGVMYIIAKGPHWAKTILYVYALGAVLAFLLQVSQLLVRACASCSSRVKNLQTLSRALGLYPHPLTGQYTVESVDEYRSGKKIATIMALAEPLLSWVRVVFILRRYVSEFFRWIFDHTPLPERVKEFRFKLSIPNLSKERVLALVEEYSDVALPGVPREQIEQMVLDARREWATSSPQG